MRPLPRRPQAADDIEAKAQACAACHGENGVPTDPKTMPIIWGQRADYLYKELHDYKSGDRKSPIMAPVVADISLAGSAPARQLFRRKTLAAKAGVRRRRHAARRHRPVPAMPSAEFRGRRAGAAACGLSYEYLAGAMNSFADGTRTNNGDMPGFMKALSDSDRDAMANYLAGL